ncbi:hypothetical protein J8273_2055 [Carpediemonas membranifera]|uniref:Uncharacterized protein n=1 Tax=Carpediemonas membranifera TaxID=201153 RepID=A0A8J6E1G5_9EUKA|nr:hypothetical protein J8273_2055 [Carpediemonas membranifera]|eukprot:KAG9396324.1 hypothetical protein J8273_2055 [Carpediemonas membranifera]
MSDRALTTRAIFRKIIQIVLSARIDAEFLLPGATPAADLFSLSLPSSELINRTLDDIFGTSAVSPTALCIDILTVPPSRAPCRPHFLPGTDSDQATLLERWTFIRPTTSTIVRSQDRAAVASFCRHLYSRLRILPTSSLGSIATQVESTLENAEFVRMPVLFAISLSQKSPSMMSFAAKSSRLTMSSPAGMKAELQFLARPDVEDVVRESILASQSGSGRPAQRSAEDLLDFANSSSSRPHTVIADFYSPPIESVMMAPIVAGQTDNVFQSVPRAELSGLSMSSAAVDQMWNIPDTFPPNMMAGIRPKAPPTTTLMPPPMYDREAASPGGTQPHATSLDEEMASILKTLVIGDEHDPFKLPELGPIAQDENLAPLMNFNLTNRYMPPDVGRNKLRSLPTAPFTVPEYRTPQDKSIDDLEGVGAALLALECAKRALGVPASANDIRVTPMTVERDINRDLLADRNSVTIFPEDEDSTDFVLPPETRDNIEGVYSDYRGRVGQYKDLVKFLANG